MRFHTPPLGKEQKQMLDRAKKLLLRQDSKGGSSAGLPSYHPLLNSLWAATESISTPRKGRAGGEVGRRRGDNRFSPTPRIASLPYLPQWLLINPSWSLPGSELL